MCMVPMVTVGSLFSGSNRKKKMSIKGPPACEVIFEDFPLPKENILGKEGGGVHTVMTLLNETRPLVNASAVGLAQGALDNAMAYDRERVQFGQADRRIPSHSVYGS